MNLGAVVVTYHPSISNVKLLLDNVVHAVSKVILSDNGSNNVDDLNDLIQSYQNVELLKLNQNTGVGFAQNRGIEQLLADEAIDAVVLFDHDSQPQPDMIEQLEAGYLKLLANKQKKVGAVGPVYIDPRTQNHYPIALYKGVTLKKIFPGPAITDPILTSVLITSGSFIPRETLVTGGWMDEGFFVDYVDIEWSFRMQNKGYELYAIPAARMYHQVGDDRMKVLGREISIHSPVRRYYLARNSMLMLRTKYIKPSYKLRESFYTVSRVIVYLFLVKQRRKYLWYILNGWYDGLRGKVGPSGFIQKQKR